MVTVGNTIQAILLIYGSIWLVGGLLSPFGGFRWIWNSSEESKEYMGGAGWIPYILIIVPITIGVVSFTIQWLTCTLILECNNFDDYGNCISYSSLTPP